MAAAGCGNRRRPLGAHAAHIGRRAAVGLALALAASPARAEWRTLETQDMRLVYYAPIHSFIAPYTAQCFANSMREHRQLWHYTPWDKVTVLLDDTGDFSNASVASAPRNVMIVHLAPVNFVYETGPSNERIQFTMSHEMAHVAALDGPSGADRMWRGTFLGKVRENAEHPESIVYDYLTVPRRAAPRWYHEGIAVFLETWMSGGIGRAQGPYDEMVFRSMVRDSTPIYDPLGLESAGTKVDFQVGVNSYLYGTRFMNYLAWAYSPDQVMAWVSRRNESRAYYANQFQHVFGRSLSDVWSDWIRWEQGFQRANLDSLRRYPLTPARDLSPRALGSVSRAYIDSTTRSLIAAVFYPGAVAHIASIPLDGGALRVLKEMRGPALYFVSSLAFDPASRQLFYTTDNNEWRDLEVLDLASGRSRRLIRDARVGDLVFNRADSSLWGVRHFNGISTVVRLKPPYESWNQMVSYPYGTDIYDLDISPDGTLLSASIGEISGRHTLRLLRTESLARHDTTSRLLADFGASIPANFAFSPDGRHLVGSSYYTGVSNIFRYDLAADSMDCLTNAETGFFRPIPLAGDSMLVFRYTGQGFVPATIEAKPLTDVSAVTMLGAQLVEKHPVLKSWKIGSPARINLDSLAMREAPYRALSSVRMVSGYPVVEGYKNTTAVGYYGAFSDPLGMHGFGASLSYSPAAGEPEDERWHARLEYKRPNWTAEFKWNPASFYDLFGPTKTSLKGVGGDIEYSKTLIRELPRTLELRALVAGYTGLERVPYAQNVATPPGFDNLLSYYVSLTDKSYRSSIGAVDPEKGWRWQLAQATNGVRFVEQNGTSWQGFPLFQAELDLGTPLPLRNSSVWVRTAAGYSPGDRDEPFANFFFGGFGNNIVDRLEPKRYREVDRFPGIEIDDAAGTTFTKGMLEWNLPPLRFERVGTSALYASWARASLFGTALSANPDFAPLRRTLSNLGAQVDLRMQLLTRQPLTFSVGYARAFERDRPTVEEWMVSLKIL